ncbi:MAG: 2-oxoacid:ferredoxin oxidoreductase subunit beta, partial [Bryobacteraceae bacterium]
GTVREITLHDGSKLILKKLGKDYDPTSKLGAIQAIHDAGESGHVVTGLLYLDTKPPNFADLLHLVDEPLATLPESRTRPSREAFDEIMDELR